MDTQHRTHPLLLAAAVSVVVFGAAGTAAVMGWLPASHGTTATSADPVMQSTVPVVPTPPAVAQVVTPPAPKPVPRPVRKPEPVRVAAAEPVRDWEPVRVAQPVVNPVCRDCGVVESVREVSKPTTENPGIGAVLGGVAGGAAGSQVGNGRGRYVGAVLGAIGGAVAGHQIEKTVRAEKAYEVTVRFDDGGTRTVTQGTMPAWRTGDRVHLNGNVIEGAV